MLQSSIPNFMYTVIETPLFISAAKDIWREDERASFCVWLAKNPEAGDVIPSSGGCRKVRWMSQGLGKRAGVRVIYFNKLSVGVIYLLIVYCLRKICTGQYPRT